MYKLCKSIYIICQFYMNFFELNIYCYLLLRGNVKNSLISVVIFFFKKVVSKLCLLLVLSIAAMLLLCGAIVGFGYGVWWWHRCKQGRMVIDMNMIEHPPVYIVDKPQSHSRVQTPLLAAALQLSIDSDHERQATGGG